MYVSDDRIRIIQFFEGVVSQVAITFNVFVNQFF